MHSGNGTVRLAGVELGQSRHVCAFFHSKEEEYRMLIPGQAQKFPLGGDIVVEILRTHPIVILGGILQENPFFVPPDEMLREVRSRAPCQGPP